MRNYSVYVLTAPDGKKYIGMTMRKPEYRWNHGEGYIQNSALYADIKKYGWDNFKKEVPYAELSKEEACKTERLLIEEYKTQNPKHGYNIEMGGVPARLAEQTKIKMSKSHIGLERDETYRRHISESKKGEKNGMYGMRGKLSPTARKVKAIKDGVVLYFDSISDASRELNLSKNAFKNISACCSGKRRSAYGYVWKYCDD